MNSEDTPPLGPSSRFAAVYRVLEERTCFKANKDLPYAAE